MHQFIPLPVVFIECSRIPEVLIKLSILEPTDIRIHIAHKFKHQQEYNQLQQLKWEVQIGEYT